MEKIILIYAVVLLIVAMIGAITINYPKLNNILLNIVSVGVIILGIMVCISIAFDI